MLIRQNQLLGEATAFLDTLYRMPIKENAYPARMVNIHHNSRLGKDLIQLESFLKFGQMNGINDGGYAIHLICEANEVPSTNHIGFTVNEENLFSDISLLETYCQLKNSNFAVYVSPISEYSPFVTKLREALMFDNAYPDYESSPNLQRYIKESTLGDAKESVNKGINKAKSAVSNGTKEVAGKLASIRKELAIKTAKASTMTGSAKVKAQQEISKLKRALQDGTKQLSGMKDSMIHRAEGTANAVKSAVNNAKKSAVSQFSSAKDAVRGIGSNIADKVSDVKSSISNYANSAKSAVNNAVDTAKSKFA